MLRIFFTLLSFVFLSFQAPIVFADIRLPKIIASNMVLQRDMPVRIWGWADPAENISVTFSRTTETTKADNEGYWEVELSSLPAGGPYQMTLKGKNIIQLNNILIGEVWVCSGQSNMRNGIHGEKFTVHPDIRLFQVQEESHDAPQPDIQDAVTWTPSNDDAVSSFSGVCYFFGSELNDKLHVPIGLIDSSKSNTTIQAWIPAIQAIVPYYQSFMPNFANLYNAMINPLMRFAIRGVIWYQGETNVGDGTPEGLYKFSMNVLIKSWRALWNEGDFPFYFVQLAPYMYHNSTPYFLPRVREEQRSILSSQPNTGMVVTTDVETPDNLHVRNKKEVARRLSLWALAKTYGHKDIIYSGPLYRSMIVVNDKIRVSFDNVGHGLVSRDGKDLDWFEIAGDDNIFFPAKAEIKGDFIEVSNPEISHPVAVRFGWNEVAQPNLINKDGLPASPFNTSY